MKHEGNLISQRLERIFSDQRCIVVLPVDHGLALGMVPGLDDPVEVAETFLQVEGVNGILSSLPVAKKLGLNGSAGTAARLVTVDSALHGGDGTIWQVMIASISEAAEANVDAIKVLMAWEESLESRARTLKLVAHAVEEGHRCGLPVLVEPVASGPTEGIEKSELERRELEGARIAWEMGADIVKVRVWDSDGFRRFVASCPVPVVALGGNLSGGTDDVVETIRRAVDMGMRGIFVGRNIWQRPREDGLGLMKQICEVVHG
ncbi:MAG: class I fructose-bisphosphate aldolase [Acidimicrobiales bacterium]